MGNPSMRVLATGVEKFCIESQEKAIHCEKSMKKDPMGSSMTTENCSSHQKTAQKCEKVVRKAFHDINMGGCPKQIKILTLCEDEWCHQHDTTSCQKECAVVRQQLSICVKQRVMHHFKRNGLKENGSSA
ncbi:unnamed protein product [Pseudo-nitzschia multistriata]|uniref:Uncharacterized protein n=1 Tax=Pseudo-nitzschia multistriata TaxID=183589 RepID=A0A448Z4U9_9STRA|nr:unnamed protein product [Pseudo-nitzschia multistriata]